MYTDLFGKIRYKVNLHTHTTLSDGQKSPAEVVQQYREEGYDALALTDHWFHGTGGEEDGITILPGAEYNVGGADGAIGVTSSASARFVRRRSPSTKVRRRSSTAFTRRGALPF